MAESERITLVSVTFYAVKYYDTMHIAHIGYLVWLLKYHVLCKTIL